MDDGIKCPLKLTDKIDRIHDKLADIAVTQARHNVLLDEHIRRTNLLEERLGRELELNEKRWESLSSEVEYKLEPLRTHLNFLQGGAKTLTIIAVISGIVTGMYTIFS